MPTQSWKLSKSQLARKKKVFLGIPSKGGKMLKTVEQHLLKALNGSYPTAYIRVQDQDRLPY